MNKWDSKRIAFISILIAMSISFVIIGTRFAAISSFPSIKLSLAGLPIKIIGYIFGPVIGFVIGFSTDVISFVFMPAFYYPLYSVALGISGMLPGLVSFGFNYFYKIYSNENILKKLNIKKLFLSYKFQLETSKNNVNRANNIEKKMSTIDNKINQLENSKTQKYQLNFGLYSSISILFLILIILSSFFTIIPQNFINETFEDKGILRFMSNKFIFIGIIVLGIITCICSLIFFKNRMKEEGFLNYVAIVVFVVLTEYINIPIVAFADAKTLKIDFITSSIASLATSFIKIWFNLVIIFFSIKIVMPLITKKAFNGYV